MYALPELELHCYWCAPHDHVAPDHHALVLGYKLPVLLAERRRLAGDDHMVPVLVLALQVLQAIVYALKVRMARELPVESDTRARREVQRGRMLRLIS